MPIRLNNLFAMEDLTMPNRSARNLVTFLLDRTGSMEAIRDDTIGGFNTYLDTLKGDGRANIEFTLVQFDSMSIDKICVATPVAQVEKLTRDTYQPRASTPLIDAAYKTIEAVEASLATHPAEKIVICIQTDGHENASTEHDWNELNALVKEKAAKGWQFNFMGVGIDAYDQGARMGIPAAATVAYDHQSPVRRARCSPRAPRMPATMPSARVPLRSIARSRSGPPATALPICSRARAKRPRARRTSRRLAPGSAS
jgi:hypothetical protein